jgi:hypothetical protein
VSHDAEVFDVDLLNPGRDRPYPREEALFAELQTLCTGSAFTDYVGVEYAVSAFEVLYFYPLADDWDFQRGEYHCVLYSLDGEVLTESVEGSGR